MSNKIETPPPHTFGSSRALDEKTKTLLKPARESIEITRLKQRITELEAQLKEVSNLYEQAHQDACFYKSCALSGETPKEGSQPSATTTKGERR